MEVGKMQTKLANWSQDQQFEFDDIYNIIHDGAFLHQAWINVKSNSGSTTPGVDGITAEDYAEDLKGNLKRLRQKLKSGAYSPEPVRRTYIPKGPDEERPLGIPTIEDRIVQESLRLVMEPIYETDFAENSFGFRPNRSCHDAIEYVRYRMAPAVSIYKHWVMDLDIKGYFDNVDHTELMYNLQDRITDNKVQNLIWNTLKAGVKENGSVQVTGKGTPQGGIVSPLLANIYLNVFDQWINKWTEGERGSVGNWSYVRYADDFLIMYSGGKHKAESMMDRVENFLEEELRLQLSPQKSSLTHAEEGLSFLGYNLQADPESGGCKMRIPKEAKDYIRSRIKEATSGDTDVSVRRKIMAINALVRGWKNYYKYCTNVSAPMEAIGSLLWWRIMHWLARKFRCRVGEVAENKARQLHPLTINGVTLVKVSGTSETRTEMPTRHTHPYLDEKTGTIPESEWGKKYRTGYPDKNPHMAMNEDRSLDSIQEARIRDRNVCQAEGCSEGGWGHEPLNVHHIRRRRSEDDDRMENLVTLCRECHEKIHYAGENITAYHEGRKEKIKLS